MPNKMLLILLALMLNGVGAAMAQTSPENIDLIRPDGLPMRLLRRALGANGEYFYAYSDPDNVVTCIGDVTGRKMAVAKPKRMVDIAVILGKEDSSSIDEYNRSAIMRDAANNVYRIMLPSVADMADLRQRHGGLPSQWREICGMNAEPFIQGGPEFWTGSRYWSNHSAYDMNSGRRPYEEDHVYLPFALKVLKVDPSQVCLFEHGNFHGTTRCFGAGDHRWFDDMNDKFSSMIVGQNCSARLYEHGDYGGRSIILNERHQSAQTRRWLDGMNDIASSMKVRCGDDSVVDDSEVCLFEHGDETGNHVCYGWGNVWFTDKYPDGQPANDTFNSMVVGKTCSVTLFEHADYQGASIKYDARTLGKPRKVHTLGDFNGKVSSLKVRCN